MKLATESEENSIKPNEIQRRKKSNRLWKIALILDLFMLHVGKAAASYHLEYPAPGFFLKHIGKATTERSTFRIEVQYEKHKIHENIEIVRKVVKQMKIKKLCIISSATSASIECKY